MKQAVIGGMLGYGLRGKPVKCQKLLYRGQRISVITATTATCILAIKIVTGGVTGNDFIDENLLPHMMEQSHVDGAMQAMTQTGSLVHFLPRYSPDYNPLFSKVKCILHTMEVELSITDDVESTVLEAFSAVISDDCRSWVDSVGI